MSQNKNVEYWQDCPEWEHKAANKWQRIRKKARKMHDTGELQKSEYINILLFLEVTLKLLEERKPYDPTYFQFR